MNIAFAGGGTAGHLYPALCTAMELQRRDHAFRALFLVSPRGREREILEGYPFQFEELPVSGFGRGLSRRALPAALRMMKAYRRAKRLLREAGSRAVVGFGAYVSVAPALAAKALGLKIIIHEQNAVMGRANRSLLPLADMVAMGLPSLTGLTEEGRRVFTGIPLRPEMFRSIPRDEALDCLGLERGWFTVLVMGGSQGAHSINVLLMRSAALLARAGGIQVVHLSGSGDYGAVLTAYAREGVTASVFPYLKEMELAYSAADLVICRCGAMTLAEVAQAGLPSVLIPLPRSVRNHQEANARVFERAGAALVKVERDLQPDDLVGVVLMLKGGERAMRMMGDAARALAEPRAAEKLADLILETVSS